MYPILLFSSYILSMTALDRFLVCFCNISFKSYSSSWFGFQLEFQAICFPLTNLVWISRKQHIMIAIAWIVSILLCIPQVRITYIHTRRLMGSTDQADPNCFYFRISWLLMDRCWFYIETQSQEFVKFYNSFIIRYWQKEWIIICFYNLNK